MQKHRCEDGNKKAIRSHHRQALGCRVPGRDDAEEENQAIDLRSPRKLEKECRDVGDDQQQGRKPKDLSPDVIIERDGEHAASILH